MVLNLSRLKYWLGYYRFYRLLVDILLLGHPCSLAISMFLGHIHVPRKWMMTWFHYKGTKLSYVVSCPYARASAKDPTLHVARWWVLLDSVLDATWPYMSAQTLRRPTVWYDGWGPANWSVRRVPGGRRHGRLDLLVNISIVFTIVT